VRDVSFSLDSGEGIAVLGPNGAGKSTVLEALAGLAPATGRVLLDGVDVSNLDAPERARRGLRFVSQARGIVAELTVTENLNLACSRLGGSAAAALERFPLLQPRRGVQAGQLSGGERQMLALAMRLTSAPRVLVVDEPSFGLSPLAAANLFETLRGLRAAGAAVVVSEQMVPAALSLAARALVLRAGRVVLDRAVDTASLDGLVAEVTDAYLGRADHERATSRAEVTDLARLTLPVALKRRLQLAAREQGRPASELVSEAVRTWLEGAVTNEG
jgi:ABC-type branched-subunit amino acid transport system ATPase component